MEVVVGVFVIGVRADVVIDAFSAMYLVLTVVKTIEFGSDISVGVFLTDVNTNVLVAAMTALYIAMSAP